eukprot:jgi/Astpho2/8627/Aster-05102
MEAQAANTAESFWKLVEQFRWFHEELLDCCRPLHEIRREGLTLGQVACLGRCNGAEVQCHRHSSASEAQLRETVWEACKGQSQHIIVSYSRKVLLQTGAPELVVASHAAL